MAVKMLTLLSRDEWLEARKNYIGGSDASAIVGMNPYKTNDDLWQEKTGKVTSKDISDKPFVKYGNDAEPLLRELFKLDFPQFNVDYVENNMFINDRFPWAHASLDGWLTDENGRKGILEIKTTEILQSMQKEKWNQRIPDNYYIQVLHYLMVTEFDFAVLKAQLKTVFEGVPYIQTKHYFIERSEVESDIDYLKKKESDFWQYINSGKKPPLVLPEI
jgi:putative phage-type endonuclease